MHDTNTAKATMLYNEIDRNPLFYCPVKHEDRSKMNVTFLTNDTGHEALFLEMTKAASCSGLAGHRSVGGFRASIYNAMPLSGVATLVELMQEFERKYG